MLDNGFFAEIEHREVPWGERSVYVPVFYQEATTVSAVFSASLRKVRALLPSPRLHPIRVSPRRCLVSISAHEFRRSDIGPYNEVGISVPFTLDTAASVIDNIFGRQHGEPNIFIRHLPVTTRIACDLGVEFAGYPKFVARIDFDDQTQWRACRLEEDRRHILTLVGRKLATHDAARSRIHCYTLRNGRLLRSEMLVSSRPLGSSENPAYVKLDLGTHPIAQELQGLDIGRLMNYAYTPSYQMILTPVIESFPAQLGA